MPEPSVTKPARTPERPWFSSGPTAKRPGWTPEALRAAPVGRSNRSKITVGRIQQALEMTRSLLDIPADYKVFMMPGSDTGAFEAAMWTLLGARGADVLSFESFSEGWATDAVKQLKIDARVLTAPYGELPDLAAIDPARDLVLAWNGTTSGVKFANADFIAADRAGLVLCDATSAAFAMDLPWNKLDAVTWSWQKVLGGEGGHGMLALSPRAVQRLETYKPAWPLPKIFRMAKGGKLIDGIFVGETINTPSMLCVEDALDGLRWADSAGGLKGLIARSEASLAAIAAWVAHSAWAAFLAEDPATRSNTSVCLKIVAPWFTDLGAGAQAEAAKKIAALLEKEKAALDIGAYRDAPPGLRIWASATVETSDIIALLPWLDWAHAQVKAEYTAQAAE